MSESRERGGGGCGGGKAVFVYRASDAEAVWFLPESSIN